MRQMCCIKNVRPSSAALAEDEHSDIRVDKVLEIRRQLGEGTYSIADRLDVIVEKIVEDLG